MSASWCTECSSKLAEHATTCVVCGAAITGASSEADALTEETDPLLLVPRETAGTEPSPFQANDSLIELVRVDSFEAEIIAVRLRGADIPAAVFGVGSAGLLSAVQHSEGSRVMVRRSDHDEAIAIVAECYSEGFATETPTDAELAAMADASIGWSDPDTGAVV